MASLRQRSRKIAIALAIVLSLTVLSAVARPLVGDELANWLPGPAAVLAEESSNGGG
ncbi:MAG: hypothetical protein P8186_07140 [Anaerolineae bacterium]|jgi:hypothetical protein